MIKTTNNKMIIEIEPFIANVVIKDVNSADSKKAEASYKQVLLDIVSRELDDWFHSIKK